MRKVCINCKHHWVRLDGDWYECCGCDLNNKETCNIHDNYACENVAYAESEKYSGCPYFEENR